MSSNRDVPILMYHHVCPEPDAGRHFPYAVTPQLFEEQVSWLARSGFNSGQLSELLRGHCPGANKQVVITFDDGARNLLTHAVPILQKYGMTATFFVSTALLGGWNSWDADLSYPREKLMTEDDVRALHQAGFEIGAHGAHHLNLAKVSAETALREMSESRVVLEQTIQGRVDVMAYPFGDCPSDYVQLCRSAGYVGACAISSYAHKVLDDHYALRRILIYSKDSGWRFRFKLHPLYMRLMSNRDRKYHHLLKE